MFAYKSNEIEEEVNNSKKAISILGGKIEEIKTVSFDNLERRSKSIKSKSNIDVCKGI